MKKLMILFFALTVGYAGYAHSKGKQPQAEQPIGAVVQVKRLALLVGSKVPNFDPKADLAAMQKKLESVGFVVLTVLPKDIEDFKEAVAESKSRYEVTEISLFYFTGMGASIENKPYLLINPELKSKVNHPELVPKVSVAELLDQVPNAAENVFLFDMDLPKIPESQSRGWLAGISPQPLPTNQTLFFSCMPGQHIIAGPEGSLFTKALVKSLKKRQTLDAWITQSSWNLHQDSLNRHQTPEVIKRIRYPSKFKF